MTNKIKLVLSFVMLSIMSLVLIACGGKKPVTPVETNITITFDSQGGTNVASKTIDKGQKVTKPSDPTKDTYTFINWFKALTDETPFSFDTVLNADITLYAKWNVNQTPVVETFTVAFNSNEGTSVATQSVKKDAKVEKPTNPTKDGYTFVAWQLNGTDYDFNASVTSNLVLAAKWEQNETPNVETFIVTFNSNEGTAVENQTVSKDAKAEKPVNPTKNGYKFIAWQLEGVAYDFETPVTQNITLSAVWELDETPVDPTKHSVTFDVDGGTEISEILVEDGKLLPAITNPTKEGHTFAGWYKDATLNEAFNMETPVNSDLILYAKWTKNSTEPTDTLSATLIYGTGKYSGNLTTFTNEKSFLGNNTLEANSIAGNGKVYWEKGDYALRLGSGSSVGNIEYIFDSKVSISKIIVKAAQYSGAASLKVNNTTHAVSETAADYEYVFDTAINSFKLEGIGKRVQIISITIYYSQI